MSAVVYSMATRRNQKLVETLRELLQKAEMGDLTDFAGEFADRKGDKYLVRCGRYEDDGSLSRMAFRLQMAAAFQTTNMG